jgi:hypothetical protein
MPRLSRFLIRSGIVSLVLGLTAGLLATLDGGFAAVRPTWIHLITVGWLTQLIFGVALWIFPRPRVEAAYSDTIGWLGFWCLNVGLLLRVVGEPWLQFAGRGSSLLVVSALLQLSAVVLLVSVLWPRVLRR